jgi:hypothetical protein
MYVLPGAVYRGCVDRHRANRRSNRDSETALPVPFTNATNPICCCQFARW